MKITEMIKAYGGMILGKTDYWHPDMNANLALDPEELAGYPVDMSAKAEYAGTFDVTGIPLVEIDGHNSYLPVTIAQYALGNYDSYLKTKEPQYSERFLSSADWLVENLIEVKPDLSGWVNDHDKMIYQLKKPWLSALSQGQAMSVLARAYQETGQTRYLEACRKALKAFSIPVTEGGILAHWEGLVYYEEYPSQTPSFVLNGFIFALWGLHDYSQVSQDPEAQERYTTGIKTLKGVLPEYQIPLLNWSKYDLYPFQIADIASIFYHKLHIQQLYAMTLLTNDAVFARQADLWNKGRNNNFSYWLATAYKIRHKLSIRSQSSYVPSVKKG